MICAAVRWGAGVLEWLPFLVAIIIMIASAVAQWLGKARQAPQRPLQGPQRPAGEAPPPARRPQGNAVDDEIGEFLQRAAQRRARQAAPAAPPERRLADQPVLAEAAGETPVGGQVSEHVQEFLDAGEFSRRTAQLGGEVAQTDAQLGEHLRDVFDHEVGRLAERPGESAAAPVVEGSPLPEDQPAAVAATSSADLIALLSNPEGIRLAIVINEILRRPEERWT